MSGRKATSRSGVGAEPDPKKRRLLDAGGPIEDDEAARQKMRDAEVYERGVDGVAGNYVGFDPDNVTDVKSDRENDEDMSDSHAVKPMGYFADKGDLRMMRWLYVNGADTRDEETTRWWPMFRAALAGHLTVCKWLFQRGAAGDIKRRALPNGLTPLSGIFFHSPFQDLSRWLILRGALCKDDNTSDLDVELMKSSLNNRLFADTDRCAAERRRLLEWAREHHQSRSSLKTFLMGTLSALTFSATKLHNELLARVRSEEVVDRLLGNTPPDQYHLLWTGLFPRRDCPLAVFAGKSGILESIGGYVGIKRGREARIVRQLTELLPGVMKELEAEAEHENSSYSSDDSE